MEGKLKFQLKIPTLLLLVKPLLFFLLLLAVNYWSNWFWLIIFWLSAFLFYWSFSKINPNGFGLGFWLLFLVGFLIAWITPFSYWNFVIFAGLGGLFFILEALKNIHFHEHDFWANLFSYLLFFSGFSLIFYLGVSLGSWLKTAIIFLFTYFISKDYLLRRLGEFNKRKKIFIISLSFLVAQLSWAIFWISLNPLISSILVLVFWVVVMDLLVKFFLGEFAVKKIIQNVIILAAFIILVVLMPILLSNEL